MNRHCLFLSGLLLAALPAAAQTPPVQNDPTGSPNTVTADWDGDTRPDVFSVVEDESGDARLRVRFGNGRVLTSNPLSACCGAVTLRGKTVKLTSKGMRGFSYYTFRYNEGKRDFQLIGFDTESFGNAMNDGAGTSSLNLLNGAFVASYQRYSDAQQKMVSLPVVRKKLLLRRAYYLQDFGDVSEEQIASLLHDNNPKAVR